MAIKVLFGPGGSGKSLFQMQIIVKQLRESRRNIVTNLAIKVPEFCAYLEKHYPDESLDLLGRLRILTEDETFEFWKYRGRLIWTGTEYDMIEDKGVNGVCYIIDEAGVSGFSATGWAAKVGQSTRGERCLWYLDQQRKFGDDVFASTNGRTPSQIAKPFRDKAHGFIKLWNGYLAQFGIFKGRGRFEWKEFLEEPGPKSEPILNGVYHIDELAECYRTQDGVGVIGNAADKGARAKGIPILWVIPAALVLALCCVFVPWLLGKGASSYIGGTVQKETGDGSHGVVSTGANHIGQTVAPPQVPSMATDPASVLEPIYPDTTPERPIWVTGYAVSGPRINVQLSDGRVLTEKDPELDPTKAVVERNALRLPNGKRIFLRTRSAVYPPMNESKNPPAEDSVPVSEPGRPANHAATPPGYRLDPDGVQRIVNAGAVGGR